MPTKTRPARKVRAGDVIDFGGQPATVTDSHPCPVLQHVSVDLGASPAGELLLPPDLPLNVQRPKKGAQAEPAPPAADQGADGAPAPVYTFGPLPSVAAINTALAKAIRVNLNSGR